MGILSLVAFSKCPLSFINILLRIFAFSRKHIVKIKGGILGFSSWHRCLKYLRSRTRFITLFENPGTGKRPVLGQLRDVTELNDCVG